MSNREKIKGFLESARTLAEVNEIIDAYSDDIVYDWILLDLLKETKARIKNVYNCWPVSLLN